MEILIGLLLMFGSSFENEVDYIKCDSLRNTDIVDAIYTARENDLICDWEYDLEWNQLPEVKEALHIIDNY